MLVINDKIKMVKAIDGFNKVGDEFTITGFTDTGNIVFKSSYGQGVMTDKEFKEHFTKVEKIEKTKRVWGNWYHSYNHVCDYRTNGKSIQVRKDGYKSKASCSPEDRFDLNKGIELCLARITIKKMRNM